MASSILMCDPVYETIFPTLLPSFRSKSLPGFSLRPAAENHSHAVSNSSCFLYHLSFVNKVFILRLSLTRSLWLCLSNLLVTAETLITVTGSSVTFDKIFRHRTLQMLILLNRNTGKTPMLCPSSPLSEPL